MASVAANLDSMHLNARASPASWNTPSAITKELLWASVSRRSTKTDRELEPTQAWFVIGPSSARPSRESSCRDTSLDDQRDCNVTALAKPLWHGSRVARR